MPSERLLLDRNSSAPANPSTRATGKRACARWRFSHPARTAGLFGQRAVSGRVAPQSPRPHRIVYLAYGPLVLHRGRHAPEHPAAPRPRLSGRTYLDTAVPSPVPQAFSPCVSMPFSFSVHVQPRGFEALGHPVLGPLLSGASVHEGFSAGGFRSYRASGCGNAAVFRSHSQRRSNLGFQRTRCARR